MSFDFDTLVRKRRSNLSRIFSLPEVAAAGNVSFLGAEPLYPVAPVIRDAVIRMAENGSFGYTVMDDEYVSKVISWMHDVREFEVRPEWVVPTLGTIHSVAVAIRLLSKPGDSIIVPTPVYNRYEQAATRLERKTIRCPLVVRDGRYDMDYAAIEDAMRQPDAKLFVFCNPHNPIGQIWRRDELVDLARLARKYDVVVFSDEIFAENSLDGLKTTSYLTIPETEGRCIVATSLGKAFGVTGFNHANILIPDEPLREAFSDRRTREHYGSMDPVIHDILLAAYSLPGQQWIEASNDVILGNVNRVKHFFAEHLSDVAVYGGEGGYMVWMDWRKRFGHEASLMNFLNRSAFLHLDAGSQYGAPGFTRMSLACPVKYVDKALETLLHAL